MKLAVLILFISAQVLLSSEAATAIKPRLYLRDPTNDLKSVQDEADVLGVQIESDLNELRVGNIDVLENELSKANTNYVSTIPQIHQKHLEVLTDLILSSSIECYLKYQIILLEAYSTAGDDYSQCVKIFNSDIEHFVEPAFEDETARLKPVELPSFVLTETSRYSNNIFTQPDVTLNAVREKQEEIINNWNAAEHELLLSKSHMALQFEAPNRALNSCLLQAYITFNSNANDILADSRTNC